jgi:uncharacterized protein (TIGR03790 family)
MILWSTAAFAGLGPAGVLVLYNADDPDAADVAQAYADARSLPPGHQCGLTGLDPSTTEVSWADFDALVRTPLEACLAALPQPDEIDALVTVRGLPYVVDLDEYVVGMEAALQVGHGTMLGAEIAGSPQSLSGPVYAASVFNPDFVGIGAQCSPDDLALTNPYQGWYVASCGLQAADKLPRAFHRDARHDWLDAGVYDLSHELFVVTRLDGFDYDDALALVDRGVAADGAFPTAPFLCLQGGDEARAARDPECELTTRLLASAGVPSEWVAPFDPALAGHEVSAYFTGADGLTGAIDGNTFAPGAIVDNLTSYGAVPQNFFCDPTGTTCPAYESQTSIARFVRAGATGAHGTVAEPLNNPFPNAGAMILYASGYSLGESFLYAEQLLYWQNLVLGDPLATPFAERPVVTVEGSVAADEPLVVSATHPDGVDQVVLYVGGVRVAEADGDTLSWTHGAAPGDQLDVLAVAVAGDHSFDRPGWPVATQLARAGVQGWTAATIAVGPGSAGTTTSADGTTTAGGGGSGKPEGGCGCGSAPGAGGVGLVLAGLAGRRRRRR